MVAAEVARRGDLSFLFIIGVFESIVPVRSSRRRFSLAGPFPVVGDLRVGGSRSR